MPPHDHLREAVYPARVFAYLLAVQLLLLVDNRDTYLSVWLVVFLAYPIVTDFWQRRFEGSGGLQRATMLVDGVLVGVMLGLVGFNLEASSVLLSLLGISVMILGGASLLFMVAPVTAVSALLASLVQPGPYLGGESFYFVSFVALVAYVLFVGLLVFEETRRLNAAHRTETSLRRRLEHVKSFLSPFLPAQLVVRESGGRPTRKRLTVFFSDIEGFTRLMETTDEMQVAAMLSSYFGGMSDIAARHGGTVDKFIGDGVLVFFGDPASKGAACDAMACVAMAMEMRDYFSCLSARWQAEVGSVPLHLRMGICTGYCLVGEFGNENRKDYTVLGSVVNRASRLEGAAEPDEILISSETFRLASPAVKANYRGQLELKGLNAPVGVFSVTGLNPQPAEAGSLRLLK